MISHIRVYFMHMCICIDMYISLTIERIILNEISFAVSRPGAFHNITHPKVSTETTMATHGSATRHFGGSHSETGV